MTTTKQFIPLSYYQRPKHIHIHRVSKEYESKRQKVKQRERERGRDSGGKDQSKRANAAQWSTINMACKRTRETHIHRAVLMRGVGSLMGPLKHTTDRGQ